jgi:hypothetical protein
MQLVPLQRGVYRAPQAMPAMPQGLAQMGYGGGGAGQAGEAAPAPSNAMVSGRWGRCTS